MSFKFHLKSSCQDFLKESVPVVEMLKSKQLLQQVQCEKAVEEAGG